MSPKPDVLAVSGAEYDIFRLDSVVGAAHLPFSLKILLENVLRTAGGDADAAAVRAVADWDPDAAHGPEIPFTPSRVLLQDFTGVPCVVDLVAMRDAMAELGGDAASINPHIPVELVIDHSVIVDVFGRGDAFGRNVELEYERNHERYQLLRWAQQAFDRFSVVPPGTGICHQVNLEYLARVVDTAERGGRRIAHPDTLVGTDSHTPMVNGLGVLGWGVGGIEAEAAMLGQPVSLLVPRVVGVKLVGELREGTTATDLVLTVAELLRSVGVVGSFVEFFGPGIGAVPLADRATLGNMSPEYGSTVSIFPIDEVTLDYLRLTGRPGDRVALVEAYAKEQGLWHDPGHEPRYSQVVELDLASVAPSIAGPKRPQDRIPLADAQRELGGILAEGLDADRPLAGLDRASEHSFPASDPIAFDGLDLSQAQKPLREHGRPHPDDGDGERAAWPSRIVPIELADGSTSEVDHGDVVIAAITSCTNTSNPSVMVAAGLVAQRAVERGLRTPPWVKTSLAPGSRIVTDYLDSAGLTPYLDQLGFGLVGYGCTTCIGNSGPLIPAVEKAVSDNDLTVCSVLSGNRNFEGRIHASTAMNFLASPPLVVAYALAGTMNVDLTNDPLGTDTDGKPVHLRDLWPSASEVAEVVGGHLQASMFTDGYADVFAGDDNWRALPVPDGQRFAWDDDSTYVRNPPYFVDLEPEPAPLRDIEGARVLAYLGDSVTTDHISPAGAIRSDSPAGQYLQEQGVAPRDFNSYGSRRGNHEVMVRGTLANPRLRNQLVDVAGGFTRVLLPDAPAEPVSIFDAAEAYGAAGTPLVILAGAEYGSGSSRDWAAKGTLLLGVRAVIASSYERIHRSNLIGMGVLPLQFAEGEDAEGLGLTGEETFTIRGLAGVDDLPSEVAVDADGREFTAIVRLDTETEREYYRHGGILQYVLRDMLAGQA
ncbi:MAG TPA: aconitate hydratase [Propionibacterium sp.]|nr:aconitate hydratase [Propionibacterium sp.]